MSTPAAPDSTVVGSAARVMLEILIHGPLSRVELAERLGLSGPSLTRLTKPLIAEGRLFEGAPQARPAGRPLQPLDLDPASEHFAGVKLTADTVYAVITDLRGAVRAEEEQPLTDHAPDVVADAVAALVRGLGAPFGRISGVGISLGGNSADGRIVGSHSFSTGPAFPSPTSSNSGSACRSWSPTTSTPSRRPSTGSAPAAGSTLSRL
ncbi:hypothetical protein [Leifsonia poae]|uniref:hypothetical protein n=1 Tax=Leifsonia poae TaxID=110933 RepID=UPI003D67279F